MYILTWNTNAQQKKIEEGKQSINSLSDHIYHIYFVAGTVIQFPVTNGYNHRKTKLTSKDDECVSMYHC